MKMLIVGSGIVGQATGIGMLEKNHEVIFVDINVQVVRTLGAQGYNSFLMSDLLKTEVPADIDAVMVCISTPPGEDNGEVDLRYISSGMGSVGKILSLQKKWPLVVVRSTVPPTATDKILIPLMEKYSGKIAGVDFGVCFNPEFLRARSSTEDFRHPWATVIGELDKRSGHVLEEAYRPFGGERFRTTIVEAELIKYINNLRNALVISFSNEIWLLAREIGLDANPALEIATHTSESAWNSHYGCVGGQAYGGSCLPKDTVGLLRFAQEHGVEMPMLSAMIKVNQTLEGLASDGIVPPAQIEGHKWAPSPTISEKEWGIER
ncbi:MAG: hypothetical protein BMS9Abin34_054 [Patescibacteria group bacterium]|nr:MAG: hypothetical protein BMS9Abin34_054 [Patescibacteria group bacterium]